MAQTLHNASTCPGNGKVVNVETGNRTVTLSVAGTGAVSFSAQLFRKESGCIGGPVGDILTGIGTDSATTAYTFSSDKSDMWLQLISLSSASTFTASVEDAGV